MLTCTLKSCSSELNPTFLSSKRARKVPTMEGKFDVLANPPSLSPVFLPTNYSCCCEDGGGDGKEEAAIGDKGALEEGTGCRFNSDQIQGCSQHRAMLGSLRCFGVGENCSFFKKNCILVSHLCGLMLFFYSGQDTLGVAILSQRVGWVSHKK